MDHLSTIYIHFTGQLVRKKAITKLEQDEERLEVPTHDRPADSDINPVEE